MMTHKLSVGFTGTQRGMTGSQSAVVASLIDRLNPSEVHHGDCIGADEDFHDLVLECFPDKDGVTIVIHPPKDRSKRAFCIGDIVEKPKPYLKRNRDIVLSSDVMIATPKKYRSIKAHSSTVGSGTWTTIKYALQDDVPIYIVYPDGSVEER